MLCTASDRRWGSKGLALDGVIEPALSLSAPLTRVPGRHPLMLWRPVGKICFIRACRLTPFWSRADSGSRRENPRPSWIREALGGIGRPRKGPFHLQEPSEQADRLFHPLQAVFLDLQSFFTLCARQSIAQSALAAWSPRRVRPWKPCLVCPNTGSMVLPLAL